MKISLPDDETGAAPPRRWSALKIVAASGLAGAALLAGIYCLLDTRAEFWAKSAAQPNGLLGAASHQTLLGAKALAADDPALRFSETGVGQVVFSNTSDTCRRHLFDNRTGRSYWVDDLPCGRKAEILTEDEPTHRLDAMRKAFQR